MKNLKRISCMAAAALLCFSTPMAYAGNWVSAKDLKFEQWPNGRPQSVTTTTGVIDGSIQIFPGPPLGFGVNWVDGNKQRQWKPLNKLCELNKGASYKCGEAHKEVPNLIEEFYLGPPDKLRLQGGQKTKRWAPLSMADLEQIPPGVKKVLVLNVWGLGWLRQSITAVYDENVSDDDLRMLALEDGVYRIYLFRED